MDFMNLMEMMNYNFESKGTEIYSIYDKFIDANLEVLTGAQLKNAEDFLLPPSAFDDGRNRSQEKYDMLVVKLKNINLEKGKGMVA
jgi:hypothetical protein